MCLMSGNVLIASSKASSEVPGLPNMYRMPSARNCSRRATEPVRCVIVGPLRREMGLPAPSAQAGFEHFDDLLPGQIAVRGRSPGDEGIVDNDAGFLAEVADVLTLRPRGIAQDEFQRVGRRPHVEGQGIVPAAHEAGTVLVVVLDAVSGDPLAPDDALAVLDIAGEGEAGYAVAFRRD